MCDPERLTLRSADVPIVWQTPQCEALLHPSNQTFSKSIRDHFPGLSPLVSIYFPAHLRYVSLGKLKGGGKTKIFVVSKCLIAALRSVHTLQLISD